MSDKEEDRAFQLNYIEVYRFVPVVWKVKYKDNFNQ